ncbi:MAG: hypothetical protein QOC67_4764 [Pseudonocardiales bacterium]|nr:hypothetical protein [Pseudonocardiales bacterium]MDT7775840.1 hypothetical protein [Pseudonocardiales bacterium]
MKGLLLRLSALVSDAEAAVRVIAYFDRPPGVGSGGRSVRQTRACLVSGEWRYGTTRHSRPAQRITVPSPRSTSPSSAVLGSPSQSPSALTQIAAAAAAWRIRAGSSKPSRSPAR